MNMKKRLVCNDILIQEFFNYPKGKSLPCYFPGSYGGRKGIEDNKGKKIVINAVTGEHFKCSEYYDRFVINDSSYNRMIKELKQILKSYQAFRREEQKAGGGGAERPGIYRSTKSKKLNEEACKRFSFFKNKYGDFYREIVIDKFMTHNGLMPLMSKDLQHIAFFNMGKLGARKDRVKLCSFIDLILNIFNISTFSGNRMASKQEIISKVKKLRKRGLTLENISENISCQHSQDANTYDPSTISRWLKK